jgi:hypothetical protein
LGLKLIWHDHFQRQHSFQKVKNAAQSKASWISYGNLTNCTKFDSRPFLAILAAPGSGLQALGSGWKCTLPRLSANSASICPDDDRLFPLYNTEPIALSVLRFTELSQTAVKCNRLVQLPSCTPPTLF